jgi:hypothetical protein|tara:strand:+ start:5096 stop:5362 length:267 start_codon:yes stop_codon:yes gene_type:complete
MGHALAIDLADSMPMEEALRFHLMSNHFPPVPSTMVAPCMEAIGAYWEDDLDRLISLPEGVGYRGLTVAPARAIIINHHLDAWCSEED